jgi:hypothetical protein
MALTFRYRYVNFGTVFTGDPRLRDGGNTLEAPGTLFANELATDVGATCLGSNEPLAILDHRFARECQFPSASAAVLHKARFIRDRFAHSPGDLLWLVTHKEPDFDAFGSLYLARWILEGADACVEWQDYGLHPQGWVDLQDRSRIDWFNPDLSRVPPKHRWALRLASYASMLDGRRRIACPKQRALHSILAAAMKRGREYLSDTSGATEFFDEVRAALLEGNLNPVFDSVLERSARFAPELAMLDREAEAYVRDIGRARKSIVYLPQSEAPSPGFFKNPKEVARLELESKAREMNAEELLLADTFRIPTDGIYLRDPECTLFQEWARLDAENSALAAGFEFTAIAYSNGCPSGALNQTDYVFSLDPERANGRHLYTVWSRLQTKRMEAMRLGAQPSPEASHAGLAARQAQQRTQPGRLAVDPWFGGPNSDGMLVRTPTCGSAIAAPGTRHDLRDDPVVEEVRTELELPIYAAQSLAVGPQVRVIDVAAAENCEDRAPRSWDLNAPREIPLPPAGYFRFAAARLRADVRIAAADRDGRRLAEQIGDTLWQVLFPEQPGALPEDFLQRHLVVTADRVAVWSDRGIAVAQKYSLHTDVASLSSGETTAMQDAFAGLVSLVRDIDHLAADARVFGDAPRPAASSRASDMRSLWAIVALGEELTRRSLQMEAKLALRDNDLLRRFANAIGIDQLLATLRDLNQSAAENLHRRELALQTRSREERGGIIAKLRSRLEWMEVFILAFIAAQIAEVVVGFYGGEDSMGRAAAFLSGPVVASLVAWALKPWKRKPEADDSGFRTSSVVLGIVIAVCLAAWATDLLKIWAK